MKPKTTSAFLRLVELCGLCSMFAESAMTRAVIRAGIWPQRMLPSDIPAVIPEVERAVKPFLEPVDVERVLTSIRSWWWSETTAQVSCGGWR